MALSHLLLLVPLGLGELVPLVQHLLLEVLHWVHEPTARDNVEPELVDVEQHRLQVVLEHKHQLRLLDVLVATGNDNVESKLVHLLLLQLDVVDLLRLLDVLVASGDEDEPDQLRLLEVVCDLHDVLPARDSDGNRNKL